MTKDGADPLATEEENCQLVEVTEEDVLKVVTSIPKLDTLILIKTMLKNHSFQVQHETRTSFSFHNVYMHVPSESWPSSVIWMFLL